MRKLLKSKKRNPGNHDVVEKEQLENIDFNVIKLNCRPKPKDPKQIMIICCFSEFGCETVGAMYCLPVLMQDYPGKYKIVVGWHGREYLYRHLVDEFWEIKPEHMWLREYARAFHHSSINLSKVEKNLKQYGIVVPSSYLGKIALSAKCSTCKLLYCTIGVNGRYENNYCPRCKSVDVIPSMIDSVGYWKYRCIKIPSPSEEKIQNCLKYIKKPCVGVFARGRKCYGRNLQPEFYVKLINLLESMGYNPIWLGEKVSTQPCPVDHVLDFSRMEESKDMESTMAIIKNCEFTIQFWTASTRLSGVQGIPYILFESPDQIWGKRGQEGIRRNLCDFGPRKLSVNHFLNIYNDNDKGIEIVKKCIEELKDENYEDMIGSVENYDVVLQMKKDNDIRIGGNIV